MRTFNTFFICVLLMSVMSCKSTQALDTDKHKNSYSRVEFSHKFSKHGIYDPSVEYDGKGIGWLSYSSIEMPKFVQTNIAKSTDHGRSWDYVATVNESVEDEIECHGKKVKGVWRNEVSSLVYDPDDPGKEWKIFWHKYFAKSRYKPKDRMFECGWIGYKYTSSPDKPWSKEIALFGAKSNFPPKHFETKVYLNKLDPDLQGFLVYSEPAALYKDGILYMSLEGSKSRMGMGRWKSRKTILLSSRDHGKSWKYLGTLTDYNDAKNLGYVTLTGESLFKKKDKIYLMATPAGSLKKSYKDADGSYIFAFDNLAKAQLKRDKGGHLRVHQYITPSSNEERDVHGGHADYDEQNVNGGIIMGQVKKPGIISQMRGIKPFRILSTKKKVKE